MEFEDWIRRLPTANTREAYKLWVMRFFDFCGVKPEETLAWTVERAEDELSRFKDYLMGEGYSGQTVVVACSSVKR